MKQYPAFDKAGVWTATFGAPATIVTADGNKVVFAFSGNAAPSTTGSSRRRSCPSTCTPRSATRPSTSTRRRVTGPFKVGSYNGRQLELERRPDYWQADKIKVQKLILEGQYDAAQAALKLRSGQLDAYFGEIPNPQKTFVDADPQEQPLLLRPQRHDRPDRHRRRRRSTTRSSGRPSPMP